MFSNSVLAKTGQLWKVVLGIALMLIGSIAPAFAASGMSWTVGTVIAILGYAFTMYFAQCPGCGQRWFWKALLYAEMYVPLFTRPECPSCKKEFDQ